MFILYCCFCIFDIIWFRAKTWWLYIMLKGKRKALYIVVCIFRVKMRYVILRGITQSLISGRMDVENSISAVIFPILTRLTFYPRFWCFCLLLFQPLSVFYVAIFEYFFLSRVFFVMFLELTRIHISFCRLMCMLDSLGWLSRPSYPSFWREGLWWPSEFNICPCIIVCAIRLLAHIAHCYGWYCVMNRYCETKGI